MRSGSRIGTVVVVVAVFFLAGIGLGLQLRSETHSRNDVASADSGGPALHSTDTAEWPGFNAANIRSVGFADVAQRVTPAVVNVSSERVVVTRDRVATGDPFFEFFGPRYFSIPRRRRETSLGSGVLVSSEGVVLTNNHVVEGAQEIQVILSDGRRVDAHLLGTDPATDVAVLKIEGHDFPSVPLGNSDSARIGDVVLAFGNPFGLGQTVTMGIISATGRSELGLADYENFIQTDAAINPGNSGGALVDVSGRLIGINTAIFSRSGGYQGIGFAVPINMAGSVMQSIVANGKVQRGSLGISFQDVDAAIADAFHLPEPRGALINAITPSGPADGAGLQRGDVIVEFDGQAVSDAIELRRLIALSPVGRTVDVTYQRWDKRQTVTVQVAELQTEFTYVNEGSNSGNSPIEGVVVEELDHHTAERMGLKAQTQGVIVKDILPSSPAARSGLQAGDAILEINREPIGGVEDFKRRVTRTEGKPIVLLLSRGGELYYLSLPS
ncbi:MAG: DegQ family serine endoprotease [candidate division Zixibacteria bacterium]|nr:DegQ family serine endoprotease [candidate division Zixibacteria bacterium]